MSKIFKGDYGTLIRVRVNASLISASEIKLKVIKPDGIELEWPASVENEHEGIIYYITQQNDIDLAGIWKLSSQVKYLEQERFFQGEKAVFPVYERFKDEGSWQNE